MSKVCSRIALTVITVFWCSFSGTTGADTENNAFQRFSDNVKKYLASAKELEKTDAFHIRFALRRAAIAERPGTSYRWNNLHTKHKGDIVLLGFIEPRGNGRLCVDFMHTYYLGGSSPIEDEGTVCQDGNGNWGDIVVRAVFAGTGTAREVPAAPRYSAKVVQEVQRLLSQLNYDPGPTDGQYGERTKRAIEYYQRDKGLSATGKVSKELVASLEQSVETLESLPSTAKTDSIGPESNEVSTGDKRSPTAADITSDSPSSDFLRRDETRSRVAIDSPPMGETSTLAPEELSRSDNIPNPVPVQSSQVGDTKEPVATDSDSVALDETEETTVVIPDPTPSKTTAVDKGPVLLTIDGIDVDLVAQVEGEPSTTVEQARGNLHETLEGEWTIAKDWHHLPWRGTYADITKNITLARNAIYRIYQGAKTDGRSLIVATHGWGGVLAYRAIQELHKEQKIPAGAIDVLVTMGSPLNAQAGTTRNAARKYGYWTGSQALAEPVKVWLNYWIKQDPSSGAIVSVANNTQLPYTSDMGAGPHNAYQDTSVFRQSIEQDIIYSLQNPSTQTVAQQTEGKPVYATLQEEDSKSSKLSRPPIVKADARPQDALAIAGSNETEAIQVQDKGSLENVERSKHSMASTRSFESVWLFAIIGLGFSGLAGGLASRFLTPRVNSSTTRQVQIDRAAEDLDSKIALVASRNSRDSRRASDSTQSDDNIYQHTTEESQSLRAPKEFKEAKEQAKDKILVSSRGALNSQEPDVNEVAVDGLPGRDTCEKIAQVGEETPKHQSAEKLQIVDCQDATEEVDRGSDEIEPHAEATTETTVDEPQLDEIPEEIVQAAEDTPELRPIEEHLEVVSQDMIIQAITGFDELIKETEKVLELGYIETDSRDHLTKAIEKATRIIKKAFKKDPLEGGSHENAINAIKKATALIGDALEEAPGAATSLQVKQK